jgi:hypothetical protein
VIYIDDDDNSDDLMIIGEDVSKTAKKVTKIYSSTSMF